MKPAEAADELSTMTALYIAKPKRLVALEMAIKHLREAALEPVERANKVFKTLTPEQREAVTDGYCNCCWSDASTCKCLEGEEPRE